MASSSAIAGRRCGGWANRRVAALGTVFFGLFDAGGRVGAFATVLWLSAALALLTGALWALLARRARPQPFAA